MHVAFVHAHPDDETLASGGLIAHLVATGHVVSLLTATRGEMGEVVPGPLSHLAGTPELVTRRESELAGAVAELGISHHCYLGTPPARVGEPRRYLDSGMQWISDGVAGPAADADERSLTSADPQEVIADVRAWLRATRPDLVVSYDTDGGYGHPDHVRCHEVAVAAAAEEDIPFAALVPERGDDVIWFDVDDQQERVVAALRHHATQLSVDDWTVTHSGGQSEPLRVSVGLRGQVPAL